jgi:hypothetical protein
MKPFIPYSLLAAAAACGFAFGQTATTTPVGYITIPIGGNASASPEGSSTYIGASLVNPAVFSGAATVSPSGGTVITVASGMPTDLGPADMLEITDGAQEGWWTTVVSSTATTVTVADNFPAGLAANVKFTVREFTTVSDFLGANSLGLGATDEVQMLDPEAQLISTLVYAEGWFNFVTEEAADNYIIYPGSGILIVRRGESDLSLVATGEVKTTDTQVDVFPGSNWLAQPNPTGGTFASMNFAAQIAPTDFLQLVRKDTGTGQTIDNFVAAEGAMFNFVTEEPADSEMIAGGGGYLIARGAAAQSTIVIPAQVIGE